MWSTAYRFAMVWFGLQRNRKPSLTTLPDKNGNLVTLDTSVNINTMKALLSCTQNGPCTSKRSGWWGSTSAQQCSTMTRLQLWLGLKMREIIRGVYNTMTGLQSWGDAAALIALCQPPTNLHWETQGFTQVKKHKMSNGNSSYYFLKRTIKKYENKFKINEYVKYIEHQNQSDCNGAVSMIAVPPRILKKLVPLSSLSSKLSQL